MHIENGITYFDDSRKMIPIQAANINKFAPVAPLHIYHSMAMNGYIPKTILLLAHEVAKDPSSWSDLFIDSGTFADTTIIMDNSVAELGEAVDMGMVYDATCSVGADYVVLPDVYGKGKATGEAIKSVWPKWQRKFEGIKNIAVLHGSSVEDWFDCVEIVKQYPVDMISIPRKLQLDHVGGENRLTYVRWASAIFPDMPIHLLGFSDEPWHDMEAAAHRSVVSIDSAVPLRVDYSRGNYGTQAFKRPDGWWDNVEFERWMIDSCKAIDNLINKL